MCITLASNELNNKSMYSYTPLIPYPGWVLLEVLKCWKNLERFICFLGFVVEKIVPVASPLDFRRMVLPWLSLRDCWLPSVSEQLSHCEAEAKPPLSCVQGSYFLESGISSE